MGTRHWPDDADDEVERLEQIIATLNESLATTSEQLASVTKDAERLNYLDSLTRRTEYINKRLGDSFINSDMHFNAGNCSLYLRDCCGHVVTSGCGSVREAIDAAIAKIGAGKTAT